MENIKKESTTLIKKCIVDALLLLMNEKEFDNISITEICNKAGVSRMAYYRNYYTKKDIIIEYLKDISTDFKKESHSWQKNNEYTNKNVIRFLFAYFEKYAFFIKTLRKANLLGLLQDCINEYLENEIIFINKNDPYEKYHMYSYSGALFNVYMKWIENDMKESVDEMAEIFCKANKYIWERKTQV